MKHTTVLAALLLVGCTTTEINVSKPDGTSIQGSWQSTGDTSRTYSDCRRGETTCLIYVEATESEDIAPIIESIVGGVIEVVPLAGGL